MKHDASMEFVLTVKEIDLLKFSVFTNLPENYPFCVGWQELTLYHTVPTFNKP